MELVEISESDFKELNLPILFENQLADRLFGIVSNGKSKYKVGWQSTNVKPIVTSIINILYSIGIDLTFVIFDFDKGEMRLKLSLDYFFYDAKMYDGFLYVITELEIIKINVTSFIVSETYALPDYFESIEFNQGAILIKCLGDKIINIG